VNGNTEVQVARVVIAGAGIVGLAAAQVLVDAGLEVTVLEASAAPGGRLSSYVDPELGHTVEHGVHGVFPRYENLRSLWREAGIGEDVYTDTQSTGLVGPDGKMHSTQVARSRGPAPLFLLGLVPRRFGHCYKARAFRVAWLGFCSFPTSGTSRTRGGTR